MRSQLLHWLEKGCIASTARWPSLPDLPISTLPTLTPTPSPGTLARAWGLSARLCIRPGSGAVAYPPPLPFRAAVLGAVGQLDLCRRALHFALRWREGYRLRPGVRAPRRMAVQQQQNLASRLRAPNRLISRCCLSPSSQLLLPAPPPNLASNLPSNLPSYLFVRA